MSRFVRLASSRAPGLVILLLVGAGAAASAQPPPGQRGMGRGMMHDPAHQADMQLFHELLDNRASIRRQLTIRADGVDTLTESDDPAVARAIQAHVGSMSARVREARPIHLRDPLFREIFAHAEQIVMRHELTPRGVRVVETSKDPYVVKLIQAHAEVVSAFLVNGRAEMMKDHPLPKR